MTKLKAFEELCRLMDGKYYEVVDPDLGIYSSHCEYVTYNNFVERIDELLELVEEVLPSGWSFSIDFGLDWGPSLYEVYIDKSKDVVRVKMDVDVCSSEKRAHSLVKECISTILHDLSNLIKKELPHSKVEESTGVLPPELAPQCEGDTLAYAQLEIEVPIDELPKLVNTVQPRDLAREIAYECEISPAHFTHPYGTWRRITSL